MEFLFCLFLFTRQSPTLFDEIFQPKKHPVWRCVGPNRRWIRVELDIFLFLAFVWCFVCFVLVPPNPRPVERRSVAIDWRTFPPIGLGVVEFILLKCCSNCFFLCPYWTKNQQNKHFHEQKIHYSKTSFERYGTRFRDWVGRISLPGLFLIVLDYFAPIPPREVMGEGNKTRSWFCWRKKKQTG